ncbi:MAG: hypothetical protein ACO3IT_07960 [Ilumatobacteraceae bacterium]
MFVLDAISTPAFAIQPKQVDEIETMLQRVERNLETASAVTAVAKEQAEALVQEKVEEKKAMEAKVELMEMVCEVYAVPVPASVEELEADRVADSVRVANMQKINK